MKSKEKFGIVIVISCGIMWGLSGILGQLLFQNTNVTVSHLVALRMFFSGILILLYVIMKEGKEAFKVWKSSNIISFLIFTILGLTAVEYTYFAAINVSNAATATVLQYTYPILVLIYTSVHNKKKPKSYEIISIFLAFLGVFLIATHGKITSLSISTMALILGLLSAFAFVFYTIYPKKLYERVGILQVMGWGFLVGGIILFIGTKSYEKNIDINFYSIAIISAITIVGTMIPFVIYGKGVSLLGPVKASLFVTVEPIFSAILVFLVLNIKFTLIDVIGFISIIIAIELTAMKTIKKAG